MKHQGSVTPAGPPFPVDCQSLLDAATGHAITMLDVEGRILSWNAGAERMTGYAADEVLGQPCAMFYCPEAIARDDYQREMEAVKAQGDVELEGWRVRRDGSRFWADIVISRIDGPDGQVQGFCKITRDLTERKRAEDLNRISEERFRLLVESVHDYAIFMLNPDGTVASWNPGAAKNKGYEAHEILGKHFSIFYPEDRVKSGWPDEELRNALRDGRFEDEGWRLRKDGSRFWASVVISAVYDAEGRHRGFSKVTRDLTNQRRIATLEDEGRRISTFLAMLGHELRNPLAPMANAAALLKMDPAATETGRMAADVMDRQLRQMRRLVDDLLDVGRITSGKIALQREPVSVRDVLSDALEAAGPMLRAKQHHVRFDVGDPDLRVSGDRARLVQVFNNVLNNAAKFTPERGTVKVVMGQVGDEVEVSIADNGPGIPPGKLQDVFNLFVQGEEDPQNRQGGLGLGLSLVQQLVQCHGGKVSAFSIGQRGLGTEIVIRLPLLSSEQGSGATPTPCAVDRPEQARLKVVVVDDNRDAANTLQMVISRLGHACSVAFDGDGALEMIRRERPDVAFLDLGLPGMSGLELAQALRSDGVASELVALTGYGLPEDRAATQAAGFRAHLTKPVPLDAVEAILADVAAKRAASLARFTTSRGAAA